MLGLFNVQLPSNVMNRVNTVLSNQVGGSYIGVVIIGSLSALLVTACVAPPLVATLMVIGESGNIFRGIVALSSLSLGLGIPLIIIGLSASRWLPKSGDYLETIKNVFGFVMFALAIWIMNPIISESLLSKLWILLIFSSIFYFLGRFRGNIMGFPMCRTLRASLVILFFGLYFYSPSYLGIDQSNTSDKISNQYFDSVESINDLNKLINTATAKDQASLIYFTADWCISCRTLEKNTFNNNQLLNHLDQLNALKADVTDNNDDDKQLMKTFNIFGPPTIIMINRDGNEMS
jgi:thiol:disulfide interchange protein DsbD